MKSSESIQNYLLCDVQKKVILRSVQHRVKQFGVACIPITPRVLNIYIQKRCSSQYLVRTAELLSVSTEFQVAAFQHGIKLADKIPAIKDCNPATSCNPAA